MFFFIKLMLFFFLFFFYREEALENLAGYSNNEHRRFTDIDEARQYMTYNYNENFLYFDDTIYHTFSGTINVWTDGSAINNGYSNSRAGYGVFYSYNDDRNRSKRLDGDIQTNQRAELAAIYLAVGHAIKYRPKRLFIYTDSQYSINCLTKWYTKWESNGYMTASNRDVQNQDFIKAIRARIDYLKMYDVKIMLCFVNAHGSSYGNDQADTLARRGANLPTNLEMGRLPLTIDVLDGISSESEGEYYESDSDEDESDYDEDETDYDEDDYNEDDCYYC